MEVRRVIPAVLGGLVIIGGALLVRKRNHERVDEAEGRTEPIAIASITARAYASGHAAPGAMCLAGDAIYTLSIATAQLDSSTCADGAWKRASGIIDDARVLDLARKLQPKPEGKCLGGAPYRTVDLREIGGQTHTFYAPEWGCSLVVFATADIDPILASLRDAKIAARAPNEADLPSSIGSFTLRTSGEGDSPIGSSCLRGARTYAVDDRKLIWSTCEPESNDVLRVYEQAHWLGDDELTKLHEALAAVKPIDATTCKDGTAFELTARDAIVIDEAHACRGPAVTHLAELAAFLADITAPVAKIRLSVKGAGPLPAGSECAPGDEDYELDLAEHTILADVCEASARHRYGGHVANDALAKKAMAVREAKDAPCVATEPDRTLTIERTGAATHRFASCNRAPGPYTSDLPALLEDFRAGRKYLPPIAADAGAK